MRAPPLPQISHNIYVPLFMLYMIHGNDNQLASETQLGHNDDLGPGKSVALDEIFPLARIVVFLPFDNLTCE
jgi:hypothetical protein